MRSTLGLGLRKCMHWMVRQTTELDVGSCGVGCRGGPSTLLATVHPCGRAHTGSPPWVYPLIDCTCAAAAAAAAAALQVNMNSVERMVEYTSYEPEAPSVIEGRRPLPGWPHAVRGGWAGAHASGSWVRCRAAPRGHRGGEGGRLHAAMLRVRLRI